MEKTIEDKTETCLSLIKVRKPNSTYSYKDSLIHSMRPPYMTESPKNGGTSIFAVWTCPRLECSFAVCQGITRFIYGLGFQGVGFRDRVAPAQVRVLVPRVPRYLLFAIMPHIYPAGSVESSQSGRGPFLCTLNPKTYTLINILSIFFSDDPYIASAKARKP